MGIFIKFERNPEVTSFGKPNVHDYPVNRPIKRSNARLRKKNKSSLALDEEAEHAGPHVQSRPPFREDHSLRGATSILPQAALPRQDSFDPHVIDFLFPELAPPHSPQSVYVSGHPCIWTSAPTPIEKPEGSFFSGLRWRFNRKKRAPALDNFTKWDDGQNGARYEYPASRSDSLLASAFPQSVMSGPPAVQAASASADAYQDAANARRSWAANRELERRPVPVPQRKGKGKGKDLEMFDIDWSQFRSEAEIQAPANSFNNATVGNSPTDSGIGLMDEDVPLQQHNDGHAFDSISGTDDLGSVFRDADRIFAEEVAAQEEARTLNEVAVQRQQSEDCRRKAQERECIEWLEALVIQERARVRQKLQGAALQERRRQEEQDRRKACELQDELERDRERQEDEDRSCAKRLQQEGKRERRQQEEADFQRAKQLQDEEEQRAAELAGNRECVCCGDEKNPLEFPATAPTSECEHISQTCTECMESWMSSEFETKACEGLKCPECPKILEFADVQRAAGEKTFAAYEKVLTRNALAALPDFAWCLSSTCSSGGLNPIENKGYMECGECSYKQCLHCRVPWHHNETCEAYSQRTCQKSVDERATEAMLDTVSKKCPGTNCGWRIQKIDGCAHMKCKRCKFEFCWECLASHKEVMKVGNTAHKESCEYHSTNLNVSWPFNMHG